jgi:hypothetical protein
MPALLMMMMQSSAAPVMAIPALAIVRGVFSLSTIAGLLLLFKPLINGMLRALLLLVHPHLSKEEKLARSKMRDAMMMQRMINASSGPSQAAELRAMAARA